jgi:hypothetical protein
VVSDLLNQAEQRRVAALSSLDTTRQDALGQFFTPARAAVLVASMPLLTQGSLVAIQTMKVALRLYGKRLASRAVMSWSPGLPFTT